MTVEAIKKAITALPEEERHYLASWLNELDYDSWDRQMVADFSPGGRGSALIEKVKRDISEEKSKSFADSLTQAKSCRNQSRA